MLSRNGRRLTVIVSFIALWQIAGSFSGISSKLLPGPFSVFATLFSDFLSGELLTASVVSLSGLIKGVLIGTLIGMCFAWLACLNAYGETILELCYSFFNFLPSAATVTIFLLCFGISEMTILVTVSFCVIWPVALNIQSGFLTIDPMIRDRTAILGFSGWRRIVHVMIPTALPSILVGLRQGTMLGVRGQITAEVVVGSVGSLSGLGHYMENARYTMQAPSLFAALIVICLFGLLVEFAFLFIENRTVVRWGVQAEKEPLVAIT